MPLTFTLGKLQKHVPVSSVFNIDKIEEKVKKAERKLMHKYLSETAYEAFLTDPSYPPNLVTMIENAVYCYAFYLHLPYMKVRLSNSGASQTKTNAEGPASPEDVEDLRTACLNDAYEAVEDILVYLEENKNFSPYAIWKNSSAYTVFNQFFITTTTQFQQYCNINNSRRLFVSIVPQIQFVEDNMLRPSLTDSLFEKLKAGNLSGKYLLLLNNYIIPAEAFLAMSQSVIPLSLIIGKEDTFLLFVNSSRSQKGYKSAENLDAFKSQLETQGSTYLQGALNYIKANITDFLEYPQENVTNTKMDFVTSATACML